MRVIFCCYLYWLLTALSSCNYSDDEALPLALPSNETKIQETFQDIYPFLAKTFTPTDKQANTLATDSIRQLALTAWATFAYQLLQSQSGWNNSDQYLSWYETHLAHSEAFTLTRQENERSIVKWNYNRGVCSQPETPQSGVFTMTVSQRSDTLFAEIEYEHLALETITVSGRHTLSAEVGTNGALQIIDELFNLAQ